MNTKAMFVIIGRLKEELTSLSPDRTAAIIGNTSAALDIVDAFFAMNCQHRLLGIYAKDGIAETNAPLTSARPLSRLADDRPSLVLVASDGEKESLISQALPFLAPETRLLIGGFGHFTFRDVVFDRELGNTFVPSFANGYPNTLIHIYQCLQNAARLELQGVVAEFGMFKGGTTMLISRFIEAIGQDWKVYGFDTFNGFPPPRTPLDMYAHPDCVFHDEQLVRRFFVDRNVEIVSGDIVETVKTIRQENIVLAFIDTDNFSPASAILDVITDRVVPGGAIVFDHFTGRDRFLYTLGERMAARPLLDDPRYFNLHDTGVFMRMQ